MFYSVELLSKRDSGFGLLWLAATLGAKSSFKKIHKRTVLGADISELCGLISHPSEPLALRLSSNLMIGAARVFKIQHDIFFTDVNNCFVSLRKVIQEMQSFSQGDFQMDHPIMRAEALTLGSDPVAALALELNPMNWDDLVQADGDDANDDFDPANPNKQRRRNRGKPSSVSVDENARAKMHTLEEFHDQVLSASLDLSNSFSGGAGGADSFSSQIVAGNYDFGFNDDPIFGTAGGNNDFGIEDLARELGEGWGADPPAGNVVGLDLEANAAMDMDMDMLPMDDMGGMFEPGPEDMDPVNPGDDIFMHPPGSPQDMARGTKRASPDSDKENRAPVADFPAAADNAALGHDGSLHPLQDAPAPNREGQQANAAGEHVQRAPKKPRRTRLLIDSRTELTDDELKAARERYLEGQLAIRRDLERKKVERDHGRLMEEMIWGVPKGLEAPSLATFWIDMFKIQVKARPGAVGMDDSSPETTPPRKKARSLPQQDAAEPQRDEIPVMVPMNDDFGFMGDLAGDMDAVNLYDDMPMPEPINEESRMRSSEEPEKGRNLSRPPSLGASYLDPGVGLGGISSASQRTSLFPWDNAARTSSTNGAAAGPNVPLSDRISIENADINMHIGQSQGSLPSSRRESMLAGHQPGSLGFSPARFAGSSVGGDNFQFDVPMLEGDAPIQETQISEVNAVTLERHSNNFLEYCKLQLKTIPGHNDTLSFKDIVPLQTSDRRVAANAFYHCLVLATKDMIRVKQDGMTKEINISVH